MGSDTRAHHTNAPQFPLSQSAPQEDDGDEETPASAKKPPHHAAITPAAARTSVNSASEEDRPHHHNESYMSSNHDFARKDEKTAATTTVSPTYMEKGYNRSHSDSSARRRSASARRASSSLHGAYNPAGNFPVGGSPSSGYATKAHGNSGATITPLEPTWSNMPNKGQLTVLFLSRFVDFFQMAALQTFMVHQLKSFNPDLPASVISHQAGVLQGAFTASQIVTSILWGRAADRPTMGRKLVLNIGLVGTAVGCVGNAFAGSFGEAVFWRLMSGAINGTVGAARTMVAECTPKPWHPRAFLLLPAAFNFANVLGPILAGTLSNPLVNLPQWFGPQGTFGGPDGVAWMRTYPFALANLTSTFVLLAEAILVHFFLDETLKGKRPFTFPTLHPLRFVRILVERVSGARDRGYRLLRETQREGLLSNEEHVSMELDRMNQRGQAVDERRTQGLPFHRIWTSNVLWVLVSVAIFDFHMGAFSNLWILFLATPRAFVPTSDGTPNPVVPPVAADPHGALAPHPADTTSSPKIQSRDLVARSLFKFANGLAFPPPTIGFAMAIIGFIGVALQFLLYPYANARYGLMRCFRGSLFLFPAAYYLAPYIALLPSSTPAPDPASGPIVWFGISSVILLQVAARTFALPATIILINNSSPHPSVLATIHGVGQACSALFRTLGPILAGSWYGTWQERGITGMAWWIVATVATVGCFASYKVRNGSGHEIFLPGEEEEMKEAQAGAGSGDGR